MSTSPTKPPREVFYRESDGKPMGESGLHVHRTLEIYGTLKNQIFRGAPDVYVTADIFFYYEQGNPRAVKAPDVLVAKGVRGNHERRTYLLWVEGVVPCVIFEVTSRQTRREDTVTRRDLYARLGVAEYYLFDPLGEYLNPRLQGFQLEGDHYEPIPPDPDGVLDSVHLGLRLRAEGTAVRLVDPRSNEPIPSCFEQYALAEDRSRAILALEEDLTEKRKQIEKEQRKFLREAKKVEAERQKAEAERQKAEGWKAEVEAERQKAEGWKAEAERLRAMLRERGLDDPAHPPDQ